MGAVLLALAGCGSDPAPAPVVAAPAPPTTDLNAVEAKLRNQEAEWVRSIVAKDAELCVRNYAADGMLIVPGMPPMKGTEALRAGWKGMLADPAFKLHFSANRVDVAKSGDLAVTSGKYTMTMTSPKTKQPVSDTGSYVTVYRMQNDGEWRVVTDINSSEAVQ